jgi:hypothetical protein
MVAAALKAGITIAALTRALSESTIFEVSFIQELVPDTTIAADLRNRMSFAPQSTTIEPGKMISGNIVCVSITSMLMRSRNILMCRL